MSNSVDFSSIDFDLAYANDANEVNLEIKFCMTRIMMSQNDYYCYDQTPNDALREMSKLHHDCNDDAAELGIDTTRMLL